METTNLDKIVKKGHSNLFQIEIIRLTVNISFISERSMYYLIYF